MRSSVLIHLLIHLFIDSTISYLLCTYYVPGSDLGPGVYNSGGKTDQKRILPSWSLHSRKKKDTRPKLSKLYSRFESDKSSGEKLRRTGNVRRSQAVLNWVREDTCRGKVVFDAKLEGGKEESPVGIWGKSIPGRSIMQAEALSGEQAWRV